MNRPLRMTQAFLLHTEVIVDIFFRFFTIGLRSVWTSQIYRLARQKRHSFVTGMSQILHWAIL
jgi:hypothetical protein